MKLQILVPQWKEDKNIIKNLLNSIETQQGIDFKDIGVIIVNDGSEIKLPDSFLKKYSFKIDYYLANHCGVSETRNRCLIAAKADYVMFCDADDMFLSNCAIYLIFQYIKEKNFDVLVSTFSEECKPKDSNEKVFINHPNDATFVHGKVYRRGYLLENKILWNRKLTIHEDSYFNYLARACAAPDKIATCNTVFYLWKYRPDSICRNDSKYILKTLTKMVDSTEELATELLRRRKLGQASLIVANFIYRTYYDMNKDEWMAKENKEYYENFMKRFVKFYDKFGKVGDLLNNNEKKQILSELKKERTNQGLMFEKFTFDQWIESFKTFKENQNRIN